MCRLVFRFFLFSCLLFLVPSIRLQRAFTDCTAVTAITQADCEALVALYNNTDGPNWTIKTDWLQTDTPCTWFGVTCTGNRAAVINLEINNLAGIVPPEMGNLTALITLKLQHNDITSLPDTIGNLSSLTELTIGNYDPDNNPSFLPDSFGNLTALTTLTINASKLAALPASFGNLSALTDFYLYSATLSSLPSGFGNLSSLQSLYISSKNLTALPNSFGNLSSLVDLELYFTMKLTALPNSFGRLSALKKFSITGAPISALPDSFGNLAALEELTVWNTRLSSLPANFTGLQNLKELTLMTGRLSALPSNIGALSNLTVLTLERNRITSLPDSIGSLTALQSLNLSKNSLKSLPASITGLTNLKSLNLNQNVFSALPGTIQSLTGLTDLFISGNKLTALPSWFTSTTFPNIQPTAYDRNAFLANALTVTDPAVISLMDMLDWNWQNDQLAAPANFHVESYDTVTGEVVFAWDPIPFTDFSGEYIVGCGSSAATPFDRYVTSTFDKSNDRISMVGLIKGSYFCAIKTRNEYNQVNYNLFSSVPSPAIPFEASAPPTVINDKPASAQPITETQFGYFLGEFSKATAEKTGMPLPVNCGVTGTMKSIYFEIPTSNTRVPGHFVRGRVAFNSGGPGHFVNGNKQLTDTIMALYRFTPAGQWKLVRCNDNASSDGASAINFTVNPAVRYRVVIWAKNGTNLKSVIFESQAYNVENSGAEKNVDAIPEIPDGWELYEINYVDPIHLVTDPTFNIIRCDTALAHTGNCFAQLNNNFTATPVLYQLNIPVSPDLATSLNTGDKIRMTAAVRRQNFNGPIFIYFETPTTFSQVATISQGHDTQYWQLQSTAYTLTEPVSSLAVRIRQFNGSFPGTVWLDDFSVEVQRSGTRGWIPLPVTP